MRIIFTYNISSLYVYISWKVEQTRRVLRDRAECESLERENCKKNLCILERESEHNTKSHTYKNLYIYLQYGMAFLFGWIWKACHQNDHTQVYDFLEIFLYFVNFSNYLLVKILFLMILQYPYDFLNFTCAIWILPDFFTTVNIYHVSVFNLFFIFLETCNILYFELFVVSYLDFDDFAWPIWSIEFLHV